MKKDEFENKLKSATEQDLKELISEITGVKLKEYFSINEESKELTKKLIKKIKESHFKYLANDLLDKISKKTKNDIDNDIISELYNNRDIYNFCFIHDFIDTDIDNILKECFTKKNTKSFFDYYKKTEPSKIDRFIYFLLDKYKDNNYKDSAKQALQNLKTSLQDNEDNIIFFDSILEYIGKNIKSKKERNDFYKQLCDDLLNNFNFQALGNEQVKKLFDTVELSEDDTTNQTTPLMHKVFYLENTKITTYLLEIAKELKTTTGSELYTKIINHIFFPLAEKDVITKLMNISTHFNNCTGKELTIFIKSKGFKELDQDHFNKFVDDNNLKTLTSEGLFFLQIHPQFKKLSVEQIEKILKKEIKEDFIVKFKNKEDNLQKKDDEINFDTNLQLLKALYKLAEQRNKETADPTEKNKISAIKDKILKKCIEQINDNKQGYQNSLFRTINPTSVSACTYEDSAQHLDDKLAKDITDSNYNKDDFDVLESKIIKEILKQNNQNLIDEFKNRINNTDVIPHPLIFAQLIDSNLLEKEHILKYFLFFMNKIKETTNLTDDNKQQLQKAFIDKIAITLKNPKFDKNLSVDKLVEIAKDLLKETVSKNDHDIYQKEKHKIKVEELKKIVVSREINKQLMKQGFNSKTKIDLNDVYDVLAKKIPNLPYYEDYQYSDNLNSNRPLNQNDIDEALKAVIDEGKNFIEDWKVKTKKIYDEYIKQFDDEQREVLTECYNDLQESLKTISEEILYANSAEGKLITEDAKNHNNESDIKRYIANKEIEQKFNEFNDIKKAFNKLIYEFRKENKNKMEENKTINTKKKLINKVEENIKSKLSEIDNFIIENDVKSKEIDSIIEKLKKNQKKFQEQIKNRINIYNDENEELSLDEKLKILEQNVNGDIKANNISVKKIYDKRKKIHENNKKNKEIIKQAHYNDLNIQKNQPVEEEKEINKKIDDKQKEIIDLKKNTTNIAQEIQDPQHFFNLKNTLINTIGSVIAISGPIIAIAMSNPLFCLTAIAILPLIIYDVAEKNNIDKENEINALKKQSQNMDILNDKNIEKKQEEQPVIPNEEKQEEQEELEQYNNPNKNINNNIIYNKNNVNEQKQYINNI